MLRMRNIRLCIISLKFFVEGEIEDHDFTSSKNAEWFFR